MADDDVHEWTPEDYNKEIERLQQERDQLENMLKDPEEKEQRRTRRAQIVGDYATRHVVWNDAHIDGMRQLAAKTEEGWLFGVGLLQLDGWRHDDDKRDWHPPGA